MGKKTWLNLFALSDEYDRCARLAPALTSLLPLLPLTITLGGSLVEWGAVLGGTTGVFALGWLALANLASVFGNRLQKQLWPNWPFDAPTNVRLMPDNPDTSPQQRSRWYGQIKKITGLDLQAEAEQRNTVVVRATVNDAVERLRNHYRRGKSRSRYEKENIRYGYARNLVGLRPVWLALSAFGCLGSWAAHLWAHGDFSWAMISTVALVVLALIARILPAYVRTRARYYTEVFFQLLDEEASRRGEDAV